MTLTYYVKKLELRINEKGELYSDAQERLVDYMVERGNQIRGKTIRFTREAQLKILAINADKIAERKITGVWKQNLITNQDLIAEWAMNHALMSGRADENYVYVGINDVDQVTEFFGKIEPEYRQNITETPENVKANKVLKYIEKYYNDQKGNVIQPLVKSQLMRTVNLYDKAFEETIKHLITLDEITTIEYKPTSKKLGLHVWLSKDEEKMNAFYEQQVKLRKYEWFQQPRKPS